MTSSEKITIIINGNHYHLNTNDQEALNTLSPPDRKQLIQLLAAIEKQHQPNSQNSQKPNKYQTPKPQTSPQTTPAANNSQRLGSGDIDALMTRLASSENARQPQFNKMSFYKWITITTAALILLILIY